MRIQMAILIFVVLIMLYTVGCEKIEEVLKAKDKADQGIEKGYEKVMSTLRETACSEDNQSYSCNISRGSEDGVQTTLSWT